MILIDSLAKLLTYLLPVMDYLLTLFLTTSQNYLNGVSTLEKLEFAIYIGVVLLIFAYLWFKYLENLSVKIWRTKGMLNMIPMDLISKNDVLKSKFISGDLLRAVK